MPATATLIGALLGFSTQIYSNALRKLPLMRRKLPLFLHSVSHFYTRSRIYIHQCIHVFISICVHDWFGFVGTCKKIHGSMFWGWELGQLLWISWLSGKLSLMKISIKCSRKPRLLMSAVILVIYVSSCRKIFVLFVSWKDWIFMSDCVVLSCEIIGLCWMLQCW